MRDIKAIEQQINSILEHRQSETRLAELTIAECEQHIEDLKRDAQAATDAGNLDAFREIQQQIRDDRDTITFYNQRLRFLNGRKDVSEDDVRRLDEDLRICQESENAAFEKEAAPVVEALQNLVYKYRDVYGRVNRCVNNLYGHVSGSENPIELQKPWLYLKLENIVRRFDESLKYRPDI